MDVFDLTAKLTLDTSEYDKSLGGAESKTTGFMDYLSGDLVSSAMKSIGGAILSGTTEVVKGVAKFTKEATDAYSDYEQLAGGIETLFGDAADQVMEDASRAFNEAGMSMNEYMETSIQSAAAMINSLEGDQAKAADLMNMSIVDMSDNVNKMGTTMEAVQNAYRGFSRGNFTMLDNLALGFSGTKEGMEELLAKAQEISGIEYDISSYSDIVQAIHVVQEEMGISGTTMKEAGSTISGSLNAVKSAWQNLITGLGNENADLGQLMDNLINSIFGQNGEGGFLNNLIPRIEAILSRLPQAIMSVFKTMPTVLKDFFPSVIEDIMGMFSELIQFYAENGDTIVDAIMSFANTIMDNLLTFMSQYVEMLPIMMDIAMKILEKLSDGLIEMIPELLPAIIEIFMAIYKMGVSNISTIMDIAFKIIAALVEGMLDAMPDVIMGISEIILELVAQIIKMLPTIIEVGVELIMALINAIVENGIKIIDGEYFLRLLNILKDVWNRINWAEIGSNIIQGIIDGIKNGWNNLKDAVTGIADGLKSQFKDALDIHSPSKVFEYYGEMIDEGLAKGIDSGTSIDATHNLTSGVTGAFNPSLAGVGGGDIIIPVSIGGELIQTLVVDAMSIANYRSGGR